MGKLILADLSYGPATVHDLEAVIGVDKRNLRPYLTLLKDSGEIHICGWEVRTGPALPVFALGQGRDVGRPRRRYKRRGNHVT